jgi:hypothetical protein
MKQIYFFFGRLSMNPVGTPPSLGYIIFNVKRIQSNISLFSLLSFLAGPFAVEISHPDFFSGGGTATPNVRTHDCNSHERHQPLTEFSSCLPCQSYSQFQALELFKPASPNLAFIVFRFHFEPILGSTEFFHHISVRGPPPLVS